MHNDEYLHDVWAIERDHPTANECDPSTTVSSHSFLESLRAQLASRGHVVIDASARLESVYHGYQLLRAWSTFVRDAHVEAEKNHLFVLVRTPRNSGPMLMQQRLEWHRNNCSERSPVFMFVLCGSRQLIVLRDQVQTTTDRATVCAKVCELADVVATDALNERGDHNRVGLMPLALFNQQIASLNDMMRALNVDVPPDDYYRHDDRTNSVVDAESRDGGVGVCAEAKYDSDVADDKGGGGDCYTTSRVCSDVVVVHEVGHEEEGGGEDVSMHDAVVSDEAIARKMQNEELQRAMSTYENGRTHSPSEGASVGSAEALHSSIRAASVRARNVVHAATTTRHPRPKCVATMPPPVDDAFANLSRLPPSLVEATAAKRAWEGGYAECADAGDLDELD